MIRINDSKSKTTMKAAALLSLFLLFAAATGFGQLQVNLTAGPTTFAGPDGKIVPMWGYTCGTAITGGASCAALAGPNSAAATGAIGGIYLLTGGSGYTSSFSVGVANGPGDTTGTGFAATAIVDGGQVVGFNVTNHGSGYTAAPVITLTGGGGTGATAAASPGWSPVVITVPAGSGLTINLTNNLSFTGAGSIPTSIVIVGQVGGGLGAAPSRTTSPDHTNAQACTSWFIAANPPGTPCTATTTTTTFPPNQANRVQSMATEVTAGAPGTAAALTWTGLKSGTYLLESGTHPSIQVPMGLIGMLVVTAAPTGSGAAAGTAYPAVAATATSAAVPAIAYNAEVPLEFSEVDPVQNAAVDVAVRTPGFSETMVWSGLPTSPQGTPGCGNPSSTTYHQCYPPAVNYTPFYFLINGQGFDKANPAASLFPATAGLSGATAATTGIPTTTGSTLLFRVVNAGLRMHTPSIVNSLTQGFNGAGAAATVAGFTLIAEDGNVIPNITAPRVQTDVLMVPGKVYDLMINVPTGATATPIFARDLALSANSSFRDSGMLAYVGVNGTGLPVASGSGVFAAAAAVNDTYSSVAPCAAAAASCIPLNITDPSKGVIANDTNVFGVALASAPTAGTLACNLVPGNPTAGICANGTFTYTPTPSASAWATDSFQYCGNGTSLGVTGAVCATVTLNASSLSSTITVPPLTFTASMATYFKTQTPGLMTGATDSNGLPLTVVTSSASALTGGTGTVMLDSNGGFTLSLPTNAGGNTVSFTYTVQNSLGKTATGTATVNFPTPSNLVVNVLDAQAYNNCQGSGSCISTLITSSAFADYRWIIEEDKTFWVDPNCTTNTVTAGAFVAAPGCPGPSAPGGTIPTFGVQFHTSHMDFVAQGCTGQLSCEGGQTMLVTCTAAGAPSPACTGAGQQHVPAVCDLGNGACRIDPTGNGNTPVNPSQVHLDPAKRYYISILPGDAANPFPSNTSPSGCNGKEALAGDTTCGHTMSGAPIPPACNILGAGPSGPACAGVTSFASAAPVNVLVLPTPLPTGKLSVMVFEDDWPLNGEQDGGGGNGTVAPIEPGLGGFNIVLWDTYGSLGDATGQDTYDMFNQPLTNSLAGTIDPITNKDACPISPIALTGGLGDAATQGNAMTGTIVTCPKYESDGTTLSPLAGQAVISNLMPDKFSVQAYPGADRIARGEEWLQTNTLDGQHPHDSFIRIGEPSYFQEFGPAGYHVAIGFANPAIINARTAAVCAGLGTPGAVGTCNNTITGQINVQRLSRTPDQRLYPSGTHDALTWTQCWVSLGDPDGEDFMFTKCDANGNFSFSSVPGGSWRLTVGDQWNDQIIDGLSTPANVSGGATLNMGNIGVQQWQSNIYTRTYIDDNKNGIWDAGEIGIPQIYAMIHYRDGSRANALTTDFNGVANFNETFPLFNWYVVEADSGRYKTTGIHTVYDAGGPADGSTWCGNGTTARPCGSSTAYNYLANTSESIPLPADLSVPGAVYCKAADCMTEAGTAGFPKAVPSFATASTGRIDPPWVIGEAYSGMTSQGNWIDFGKAPFATGENGGIHGQVAYAATRPFDDASQMVQQPWQPDVPNVTVNLYQEGFASDGVTPTLTLVDTTVTSSWDAWAQGFYPGSTVTGGGLKPYMSCPGQGTASGTNADLFYFTLFDQPNYLDWYNSIHNGGTLHPLPYNAQYKCYDAMHIWNQLQPAPYDGQYSFPSITGINPTTGAVLGTNCNVCVYNPDSTDTYRYGHGNTGIWAPGTTSGVPMLPAGKYVVEVVTPPGYEIEKEEDKNLLIGDNMIAPAVQQFPGVGGLVFILPDQASVASMYDETGSGYNGTNYQNSTTGLGLSQDLSGVPGFPGFQDPVWPCVGEMRVVPDFLSEFPLAFETAPFAGATRPLCDRKEVNLASQMAVSAKFYIFTTAHIAAKYTGVITDDFTSEFDPFSPQFGEKFAPANLSIATKDYLGNELSRVYSDHWGVYDGLTFSSWNVNPPNITGYAPAMMVQCMNDPGPIVDNRIGSATAGQLILDPLFNPAYSNFCYEEPYMPGLTTYLDTPVVPTQAFVGAGYNNPDCSYPDATPAIAEVDGDAGIGPWVAAAGTSHTLTITALGNQQVNNADYSGPSATVAPYNMKTIQRHYGFGTRCTAPTAGSATCNTTSSVTIGGVAAPITGWIDTSITVTVPNGVPNCVIQQQAQYQGTLPAGQSATAQCGQLVITAGNGLQSIDTVTVTIGGTSPKHVGGNQSIQAAIDAANPGDLIIVDPTCTTGSGTTATVTACETGNTATAGITSKAPGAHSEMLLMWKPVRLQGVGAATSVINANATPAGKLLDPWRRHVNCLFGLTLQGQPNLGSASGPGAYDQSSIYTCPDAGWNQFGYQGSGKLAPNNPQVDRLPLEAIMGWDATLNGNLAEQLQEPALMGAFEGAGITVLAKGVDYHASLPWTDGTEGGAFPASTTLLSSGPNGVRNPQNPPTTNGTAGTLAVGDGNVYCHTLKSTNSTSSSNSQISTTNPYPSNFECNPSSIDGLTITNSSQGGGGIFLHGWANFIQVANNRIYNNAGTLTGGISVGQGEFPTPLIQGGAATNAAPGSCSNGGGFAANQHLPYCLQLQVNLHNNYITNNSSLGDELFSGTLSGGGGATFCTGNDYYKFNYNWVCGNLSSGEGGGIVHLGELQNGDIEHNSILFNQSQNPTIPTNGGGIMVEGTPDTDPVCGVISDADCPPGLSDGIGHNLVINANLIQGNMAESGSGGGIRLQQVNGTEVSTFPNTPSLWNDVRITNNIIVNNVAGWDGAGISIQDSLRTQIVNNTIVSNDTLASSGVLTQSIGTPIASAPAGNCVQNGPTGPQTASCPQPAGVVSMPHSPIFTTSLTTASNTPIIITCPSGEGPCQNFSNPKLDNNIIWGNRSFQIGVGSLGSGTLNQQNIVSLFNAFTGTAAPVQTGAGQCTTGVFYWDIGVRGDTSPTNHVLGYKLNPRYSTLDDPADYPTDITSGFSAHNTGSNPAVVTQYCNGSRVPPTCTVANGCGGPSGYGVPPGIVDASTPNPVFSLTPSATVDEGNNWINVAWGPLSLSDESAAGGANGNYGGGAPLGNYSLTSTSPAINYIPTNGGTYNLTLLPTLAFDFFGNPRPDGANNNHIDIGAVEFTGSAVASVSVTPTSLTFNNVVAGTTSASQTLTLTNSGGAAFTGTTLAFTGSFSRPGGGAGGNCGGTLAAGASCTINVVFSPSASATGTLTGSVTITGSVAVTGSPVSLTGNVVAATRTFTVSPTTLAFGNQARGVGSPRQTVTVTNTGNVALAGGTYTISTTGTGTGTPFARAAGGGGAAGTCGATLAVGASCTYNVVFTPPATSLNGTAFSRTLTVAYTGATSTPNPPQVTLTGTTEFPAGTLTFSSATGGTLAGGVLTLLNPTGTAVVTITNTGTGNLQITAENFVNGLGAAPTITTTCSFTNPLAPAGTCTVTVKGNGLDASALSVPNNGTGTTAGASNLTILIL